VAPVPGWFDPGRINPAVAGSALRCSHAAKKPVMSSAANRWASATNWSVATEPWRCRAAHWRSSV
jgi:hypothetical protein